MMEGGTKLIPRVSSALLTLGATACGGGGDGGLDGGWIPGTYGGWEQPVSTTGVSNRLCQALYECDPGGFDYASHDECVSYLLGYVEEYVALYGSYSESCGRAFLHYYNCIAEAYEASSDCSDRVASDHCVDVFFEICDYDF